MNLTMMAIFVRWKILVWTTYKGVLGWLKFDRGGCKIADYYQFYYLPTSRTINIFLVNK